MPNKYTDLFKKADESFDGKYAEQLKALSGLTEDQIKSITPDTEAPEVVQKLIDVVQQASKENLEQADLIHKIKALGSTAVSIAKNITGLGNLF